MVNKTVKKILFLIMSIFNFQVCSGVDLGYKSNLIQTPIQVSYLETEKNILLRVGFWPCNPLLKCKGTFIVLGGMGGFLELYQETADVLTQMGYDVYSFDWRGQGGSTRLSSVNSLLHVKEFREYISDLDFFMTTIIHKKAQKPLYLMAISMGGHLALRYLHFNPNTFSAAILLAPMIEINTTPYPALAARLLTNSYVVLGLGERFAPGYQPFDFKGCTKKFNEDRQGDLSRYLFRCMTLSQNPNLAVGGPSFYWLKAAFESCDLVCNPSYLKKIKTPCLMIISGKDHLIKTDAQITSCKNLSSCQSQYYEKAHHNLLMDSDTIRNRFWQDFKDFMASLPMGEPIVKEKSQPLTP